MPASFTNPGTPNLADFIVFAQNQGVTVADLDPSSPYYQWALTKGEDVALYVPQITSIEYVLAVYNYAFHALLKIAQDTSGLALSSLVWASGVVTATTAVALIPAAGSVYGIAVSGAVPLGYNGAFQGTVTGANTLVYPLATNPGAATQAGFLAQTFFSDQRKAYGLLSFPVGAISSSSDEATSQSVVVPEFFKTLTLSGMDLMRTPWGREYLDYAQTYGQNVVGVS